MAKPAGAISLLAATGFRPARQRPLPQAQPKSIYFEIELARIIYRKTFAGHVTNEKRRRSFRRRYSSAYAEERAEVLDVIGDRIQHEACRPI